MRASNPFTAASICAAVSSRAGHRGHWESKDWILAYDGASEAKGEEKHLWSEKEYGNFRLIADWRQPAEPRMEEVPCVLPDVSEAKNPDGTPLMVSVMGAGDSGLYLRGSSKSQVNIWNWPVGSGELYGYRTDGSLPPEIRRGVTPLMNADNPPGQWNRFEVTLVGNVLSVVLNGKEVIRSVKLPGLPTRGSIALQHHGDPMEFANL